MGIGLIIIGTELLTGKRRDSHFAHSVEAPVELSCLPHMQGDYRATELRVLGPAGNVDCVSSLATGPA